MKKYLEYAGIVVVALVIGFFVYPRTVSPSFSSATGLDSLSLKPSASTGDTYGIQINGVTTEDMNGNIVGNILQGASAVNQLLGTTLTNELIQGASGFSLPSPIATTTTITATQFCNTQAIQIINTTAAITITFPTAAAVYTACNNPAVGSFSQQIIVNDSTNSVIFAPGTGMRWLSSTLGVGTTTVSAVATTTLNASSVLEVSGIWESTSTLDILNGSEFH